MFSRQDWVEVRVAGRPKAGNAFSKHFRRFLVTRLKELVIPRKRAGKSWILIQR